MAAYLDGRHHPQQALAPRVGYVALVDGVVVGYIAGHRTRRLGTDGEVQYLYVAPPHRRRGVGTGLLRSLAEWFRAQGVAKVCVNVNPDSPPAAPFYLSRGATPLDAHWYVWPSLDALLAAPAPSAHRPTGAP
ncbi:MAG TPA: GNAT family N-acetyltransferase [Baekduia sp.]|nr:GNAT family N-acetyltransferase [Baekduia sp.]